MKKVTFDTNAWQRVVVPGKFANDPRYADFVKIHEALKTKQIEGYIVETVATLEGYRNIDRAEAFSQGRLNVDMQESTADGGTPSVSFSLTADPRMLRPLAPVLVDRLKAARDLGVKLLTSPRLGLPVPPELTSIGFEKVFSEDQNNRTGRIVREIEARGLGSAGVKAIGTKILKRLNVHEGHWAQALNQAQDSQEEREIRKGVAEWSDGDSVAAHLGYGNDLFCTEDTGRSSAASSIMDDTNRKWLEQTYGMQFATLAGLAKIIP